MAVNISATDQGGGRTFHQAGQGHVANAIHHCMPTLMVVAVQHQPDTPRTHHHLVQLARVPCHVRRPCTPLTNRVVATHNHVLAYCCLQLLGKPRTLCLAGATVPGVHLWMTLHRVRCHILFGILW